LDFGKAEKEELLTADIEAFNGQYEKLIKILERTISVKQANGIYRTIDNITTA